MRTTSKLATPKCLAILAALAMLATPSNRLSGQSQTSGGLELAAGPVAGRGTGVGLHVSGRYAMPLSTSRLALRFEGTLSTWRALRGLSPGEGRRVSSLGLSLERGLSSRGVQPYALIGAGSYALQGTGLVFGLNAGAGLRFRIGRASLFTEARAHWVETEPGRRLVPLTFGVRF
jgi:hypothetical protein